MDKVEDLVHYIFRWVFLLPVTVLISGFGMVLITSLLFIFSSFFNLTNINFIAFILSISTPIIWLNTSYLIAPSHNIIANWFSYVLGCFAAVFLCYIVFGENDFAKWKLMILLLFSSALSGLVYSILLHKKLLKTT